MRKPGDLVAARACIRRGLAVDARVGLTRHAGVELLIEYQGVVARLGPLDGEIGLARQAETNHRVRATLA